MNTSDDKTQILKPGGAAAWILSAADRNLGDIEVPPQTVVTLGRKTECDVVIPSQYVSRRHAEVYVEGEQLFVRDLDSTHGTLVNSQPITQTAVSDGDEIRIDRAIFVVRQLGDADGDSAKTVMRSVDDMKASMDQAVQEQQARADAEKAAAEKAAAEKAAAEKAAAEKAAAEKAAAEKAAAEKAAAEKAANETPEKPGGAGGNWWEKQEKGVQGTRLMKSSDLQQIGNVEAEQPVVDAEGPMLIGLSPAISELRIELSPGAYTIGKPSNPRADIKLDDETVSTSHAQLIGEGNRWKVVNTIATNGTYVNEQKVQTQYLKSGDTLRIGVLSLRFVNGSESRKETGTDDNRGRKIKYTVAGLLFLVLVLALVAFVSGIFEGM